ncbi:DUF2800 domain-containing protein [Sporosarcina trichiuri]|uniref:DUF2800 domain-containing protein n=1 Tax=Sporosarcina trichiuri TaxID=3056445 RepID=UPI0025B57B45|nr:DUF2800 domain-containing protein [Sporosarcina sp. 0.2-SM1T-5]WJY27423.1 DUF2800 domain-containing protein [Sporosarcina sp. 0.2-SM1T-5]WJY27443.1 DUF2800 domain-containing protein [Sporosarcina sp. 0.2-SM1T-5]
MTAINHAERAHAKLSASGSSRWMACTPSAAAEKDLPDSTSIFAEEGTAAHELSELFLQYEIGEISKRALSIRVNKFKAKNEHYSQAMEDYVKSYVDVVMERVNEARAATPDALVMIEQRLDFSEWVPEGFGTGDVLIIADGQLEVVDLKYGKGVPVSAENNSQMRLYGLGAYDRYSVLYDIDTVRMTIVQPRLDSISSETLTADELLWWGEEEVRPKAQMAWDGEGEFVPGDHCRWCKIAPVCRARAEENLKLAEHDFAEPATLSHEEVAQILPVADQLQKWAKDISDYALEQAEKHGVKFPGFKLVEGRSNRKYSDTDAVEQTLLENGVSEDAFLEKKLLTITKLEKSIGKTVFSDLLGDLIEKPPGKPTLVPEDDKRPELSSAASAAADFGDDL